MAKKKSSLTPEQRLQEALVPESEWPYPIPKNWCWTSIGYICSFIGGGTPNKAITAYWDGDIPWASVKDIKGPELYSTVDSISQSGLDNSAANLCDVDDLIVVTRIEPGKAIIAKIKTTVNQDLKIVKSELSSYFLYYYFLAFQNWFLNKSSGSTVKGITLPNIKNTFFPLPPLSEQQRIVDRIESLFAKLDEAKQKAQDVLDGFEPRKAAILNKAFTGALTRQWREEHPSISNNLIETVNDRSKQWGSRERKFFLAEQEKIERLQMSSGHEWIKCTIGAIGIVSNGSTPSRKINEYWNGDIPWVSSGEVRNSSIFSTKEQITPLGYENSSVKLLPVGTVLIAMIGEGKTRGQSAVLQIPATINQNIAAIIIENDVVNSSYLAYWLQKNYTSNRQKGSGSGPQALNCQRVRELDFILAGLEEQKEIVRILDSLLSKEQQAKEAAESVLDQIDLIKKSILARAFRGDLGTNDSTEESAMELLKEILEKEG